MDYANQKYLMMCRGVGFALELACFTVLLALSLLAAYALYDGATANREAEGVVEMRQQIVDNAADFKWREGMVAWLSLEGTHIDYPVMQAQDNKWYLSHDYTGRPATIGSVFLDYRNKETFEDEISLIYGHRANNDLMFTDIAKYADREFFLKHRFGRLKTREREFELEAVEYLEVSVKDRLYSELAGDSLGLGSGRLIVLSTCSRKDRRKRDVLILRHKK